MSFRELRERNHIRNFCKIFNSKLSLVWFKFLQVFIIYKYILPRPFICSFIYIIIRISQYVPKIESVGISLKKYWKLFPCAIHYLTKMFRFYKTNFSFNVCRRNDKTERTEKSKLLRKKKCVERKERNGKRKRKVFCVTLLAIFIFIFTLQNRNV